jgi:hypothetical protein
MQPDLALKSNQHRLSGEANYQSGMIDRVAKRIRLHDYITRNTPKSHES